MGTTINITNTDIRNFENSIIAMANASPLPIEIKRLVFSEIMTKFENESNKTIAAEQQNLKELSAQKNLEEINSQEDKENE